LYYAAKGQRTSANEKALETLLKTQAGLIEAQTKRIDLLQNQNMEQQKVIDKQAARIEYLEEVLNIHGPAQVVP
ncbi:MAG TPA: hypothetical protein VFK47_14470, partial [Ktedonobacteraceae bacterium]|nr:hypothetical protein [Ktedonobacteraceae bacterium]